MSKPRCIILRALPGAGKTRYAMKLSDAMNAAIVSADHFFMMVATGEYKFDVTKLGEAHAGCMLNFLLALKHKTNVIVDNTNTQRWEYAHYVEAAELAGYEVEIHELDARGREDLVTFAKRNKHGVSLSAIGAMYARWEEDPKGILIFPDNPRLEW